VSSEAASGRELLRAIARRAMLERGLVPDFPADALAQAEALPDPAAAGAASLPDLRGLAWVSVDNDDTRDIDQLSVAEELAGGAARLLVAVADVDAAVAPGSPLDDHARANTTSVYTAAEIFPMLPERLSTGLTSLNEDEDRLALVVSLTVEADGSLRESGVSRGLVRNKAKLAYGSVSAWLDGAAGPRQASPGPPRSRPSCGCRTGWARRSSCAGTSAGRSPSRAPRRASSFKASCWRGCARTRRTAPGT
jgi:exoribonuclease-2